LKNSLPRTSSATIESIGGLRRIIRAPGAPDANQTFVSEGPKQFFNSLGYKRTFLALAGMSASGRKAGTRDDVENACL
jgi:hypothetical protein